MSSIQDRLQAISRNIESRKIYGPQFKEIKQVYNEDNQKFEMTLTFSDDTTTLANYFTNTKLEEKVTKLTINAPNCTDITTLFGDNGKGIFNKINDLTIDCGHENNLGIISNDTFYNLRGSLSKIQLLSPVSGLNFAEDKFGFSFSATIDLQGNAANGEKITSGISLAQSVNITDLNHTIDCDVNLDWQLGSNAVGTITSFIETNCYIVTTEEKLQKINTITIPYLYYDDQFQVAFEEWVNKNSIKNWQVVGR